MNHAQINLFHVFGKWYLHLKYNVDHVFGQKKIQFHYTKCIYVVKRMNKTTGTLTVYLGYFIEEASMVHTCVVMLNVFV